MINKRKVFFICPYSGSMRNALAKHTNLLFSKMIADFNVTLLTQKESELSGSNVITVNNFGIFNLIRALKSVPINKYDYIVFQYVPNMYSRYSGINLFFPIFIFILKILYKKKVVGIFHELFYPFQNNYKAVILHVIHRFQLFILSNSCTCAFTSTEYFKTIISKQNFLCRTIEHLPSYSNLKKPSNQKVYDNKIFKIALIGGLHPSKNIEQLVMFLSSTVFDKKIEIHITGVGKAEIKYGSKNDVTIYEHLEDEEFSNFLFSVNLVVCYFVDGISTRRGSLMSALQNGKEVFTSVSHKSDTIFHHKPPMLLSSTNWTEFCYDLSNTINNSFYTGREDEIKNFYQINFSIETVYERFKKLLP